MLVLTRRVGEAVMIGDEVTFKILGVRRGLVRVGIDAPRNIAVHREEVFERMQRDVTYQGQQDAASDGSPG